MKVVYKLLIQEKIREAIREAKEQNKKINHIILTEQEWKEFAAYLEGLLNYWNPAHEDALSQLRSGVSAWYESILIVRES